MKYHFEPLYRSDYGLTKSQWRRLSGIEKVKVIQEHRAKANLPIFSVFLETGDPDILQYLPFPPNRKFEPIDPIPSDDSFW